MGNPLSNTTTTTSKPLTAVSLANVPHGPGMLDKSLEKKNHEMVALGIPANTAPYSTHDASGSDDIQLYDGEVPTILKNFRGWVNPEDLPPKPQCIAQQNDDDWLRAMTRCTKLRCTNKFIFCTHRQWLTELSCLRAEFHPSFMERYNDHCSRSVLAKAQLMHWIQAVAGRSWIVDIGDTNKLQNLSPKSLLRGYKTTDVAEKAPYCMRKSTSLLVEKFDLTMLVCTFTSTTISQGNAARPWEYSPRLKSMTPLSWDTAGYDLTHGHIADGVYFDVECFCHRFSDQQQQGEPCSTQLDLTKERLWIHAVCGPSVLPKDWEKSLKTLGQDYIPMKRWERSSDITNMPENVTALSEECTTDACDTDSEGFCQLVPVMDRSCMCSRLDYDLCQGACQDFESRKQYVQWIHKLCGGDRGWNGLPDDWHQLLEPRPRDMIPWRWTLKPASTSDIACPSYPIMMGSLALINVVAGLAVFFGERYTRGSTTLAPPRMSPLLVLRALVLASVQLAGYWLMVEIIQSTPRYSDVPEFQLFLLFCSLPRLGWLVIAPTSIHRPDSKDLTAASSALCAEVLLQIPNLCYMAMTVIYGLKHGIYFGVLPSTEVGYFAWLMYGGALMWLVAVAFMALPIFHIIRTMFDIGREADRDLPRFGVSGFATTYRDARDCDPLLPEQHRNAPSKVDFYGAVPGRAEQIQSEEDPRAPHLKLYVVLTLGFPLIFLAQSLFWIGFLRVSGDDFCPPSTGMLTGVELVSSLMAVALKFVL
ncbi:uncharacterized protein FIESC28_11164 [Fusarium coffeatum]|uniref:Uncharacterized protein n=1 Tax=Fusarium coffeatum TaxID=231269 RepID=A0A366QMJ9_9HYPO|nr:uncharacterized protein FIESC28_11164 [Fusarium coffeatum]RBR06149.1 hypothetical protein FIESC28_11164 [Fusarium coffeatum]